MIEASKTLNEYQSLPDDAKACIPLDEYVRAHESSYKKGLYDYIRRKKKEEEDSKTAKEEIEEQELELQKKEQEDTIIRYDDSEVVILSTSLSCTHEHEIKGSRLEETLGLLHGYFDGMFGGLRQKGLG